MRLDKSEKAGKDKNAEWFCLENMILGWFAEKVPGDTYRKKLYYWNLIQYIMSWVNAIFIVPLQAFGPVGWYIYITVTEFFTNDGHIYGDFAYLATGQEIRALVWIFSMLFVVVLSYLWAFRGSRRAGYARTISYLITLGSYVGWTLFFTWAEGYDYAVWANYIVLYEYNPLVILLAAIALLIMWFGVIISNGYLIYKSWKAD